MNLYLVRHAETDWNREGRAQGRAEVSLNALGLAQAQALAVHLASQPLAAVYSSPAFRARQTAEPVAATHGLAVRVVEDLVELDVGALDGVALREMRDRFPDFFRLWTADAGSARFPGGETLAELQERAWGAVQQVAAAHAPTEAVLVVSHAFALYAVLCGALGMPLNNYGRLHQDPGGVSLLRHRRGAGASNPGAAWTLAFLNQTSHLGTLAGS